MTIKSKRTWTESDRKSLIDLWSKLGSNTLIALKMNRTFTSVRAQASRMGLPQRNNPKHENRLRWSQQEETLLRDGVQRYTDEYGRLQLVELAGSLNRSIDSVFKKLTEYYRSETELLELVHIGQFVGNPNCGGRKFKDRRKQPMTRNCMTCGNDFWSEGAHNRICNPCKDSDYEPNWW